MLGWALNLGFAASGAVATSTEPTPFTVYSRIKPFELHAKIKPIELHAKARPLSVLIKR